MNKIAKKNRYVILGNQIQLKFIHKILKEEPFYFYTEFLGTHMIDFSYYNYEYLIKDGIQVIKF